MSIKTAPGAEPDMRSAYGGEMLWQSPIYRIGKHDWRLTIRRDRGKVLPGYEWRRAGGRIPGAVDAGGQPLIEGPDLYWKQVKHWPRYTPYKHGYGLPRSLRAVIYEPHREVVDRLLAEGGAEPVSEPDGPQP